MISNYFNSFITRSKVTWEHLYVPGTMLCSSAMEGNKTDVK